MVRGIDFCLQTMMFYIIYDTFILKPLIHDDPLHLGMPRVRFPRAARANGNQTRESIFSNIVFVSDDRQTEKTQMYK